MTSLTSHYNFPGTHLFFLEGDAGRIEAELTVPDYPNSQYLAVLGHPHSLQGGTMHNKVVTTLVRIFRDLSIPTIRFNFRGVGQSAGIFDGGLGESEDMLTIVQQCQTIHPDLQIIYAGFSFGSYVAYRAACKSQAKLLITISPPVERFNYLEAMPTCPWVIAQGVADEVVSPQKVIEFAALKNLLILDFKDTGHFFHGKLIELKQRLISVITEHLER